MTALYPHIEIDRIKKPSTFYAIPVLGFVTKILLLIPVQIELFFLRIVQFFFSILNSFSIFFTGKYWKMAYELNLGLMRLETNVDFYLWGLTDTYPGFALDTTNYSLHLPYNKKPSRFLATPLLGILIRTVLLIPFMIWQHIVSLASFLAIFVSWIAVFVKRRYPQTTYEIVRDSTRLDRASSAYFLGMSDMYPSFSISMKHSSLKLLLLIIAALLTLFGFFNNGNSRKQQMRDNFMHQFNTVQKPSNTFTY